MPSPEPLTIGIVEDDPIMGESLVQRLRLEGYRPRWWQTGGEALDEIGRQAPDLLICDIRLPDMSGEDVFRRARLGSCPVVFVTAFGEIDQAVRLVQAGAEDYVAKPFDLARLLDRIDTLVRRRAGPQDGTGGTLGVSPAMRRVEALLARVADIDSTLLLTGESGAGKEVAARFVHQRSARAGLAFLAVNCAAIPAELIDSELFGHEKGAFTGASSLHRGFAERAGGGILFLDEIAELQPQTQGRLLRLVQERAFWRVGGERAVPFAARLICATNADLEARVAEGRFRKDLFYRINVIPVAIPPLRERREDIVPLLDRYVLFFAEVLGRDVRSVDDGARAAALAHAWPGNVRELRNRVERAVALAEARWIDANDLFPELHAPLPDALAPAVRQLAAVRDEAERQHIRAVLKATGGHVQRAAEILGISRTTMWEKMRRLGLAGEPPG